MFSRCLIDRVAIGGLIFTGYALWEGFARLPRGMGTATTTLSFLWLVALLSAGGAVLSMILCALAVAATRPVPLRWRAAAAASVETTRPRPNTR
jgi:hypothetical protein